ncbi:DMT family transporter [Mobilicoccus caccae]|uniref:Transporter family-2 protein n=1 Tax=Mobilicoccus caccae TaxID=1859295 RepID=A0ABQ6IP86_9MICO|nr:DMT family transporter [Mobilicoccus caccae]GMA38534.1 hypothetical protein GCM10025883_05790 [Mobilicoccus caccae]
MVLAGVAAFTAGALTAFQSRANAMLATTFQSAIDAALWSFLSGWILLSLGLFHPKARAGLRRARQAYRDRHLAWWQFFGGLGGGFFVAAQVWSVPQIGVAMFTMALVGGQTTNALLVDGVGLGPAGRVPVSVTRVVAALGTFIGVGVAMAGRGGLGVHGVPVAAVLFAVAAGAGLAVQQAVNGRVNRHSGSVAATTWVNFTWGSGLLLGILLTQVVRGTWSAPVSLDAPVWAWTGGMVGIVFVAVGAVVVHHLGVLLAALLTLSGQLIGAVVVDLVSPGPAAHVDGIVLAGVALTLASAVGAAVAARRARSGDDRAVNLDATRCRQGAESGE